MVNHGVPFQKKQLHTAAGADADGLTLNCFTPEGAYVKGAFQIGGTVTTATVYFEGTVNGTVWVGIEAKSSVDSATTEVSATAAGVWFFECAGLSAVRARLDWTAGSIDVWGTLIGG